MAGIGGYSIPCLILPRVLVTADSTGYQAETWPEAGAVLVWAAEASPSGAEQVALGLRQHTSAARLRVRGWATVAAVDRVKRNDTGDTLRILGVWREGRNTVLTVEVA